MKKGILAIMVLSTPFIAEANVRKQSSADTAALKKPFALGVAGLACYFACKTMCEHADKRESADTAALKKPVMLVVAGLGCYFAYKTICEN